MFRDLSAITTDAGQAREYLKVVVPLLNRSRDRLHLQIRVVEAQLLLANELAKKFQETTA